MSATGYRRVVTGINEGGESCIIIDGPVPGNNPGLGIAWRTESVPADNSGSQEIEMQSFTLEHMQDGSTNFLVAEYPPGAVIKRHKTDTTDYVVVTRGEVVLTLETGETRLQAGDFVVNRGVMHGWRNEGVEPAVTVVVSIPAHPLPGCAP